MHVLITGGTGFVGINLATRLAALGDHVVLAHHSPLDGATRRYAAHPRIAFRPLDVTDRADVRRLFREARPEAIVHAAVHTALDGETERGAAESVVEVNVGGTTTVLIAAAEAGVKRAIYVSSSGVFPIGSIDDPPIAENAQPAPARLYGITKYASELLWRRLAVLHGLTAVAVRIAQPFGPMERRTGSRRITSPIHEWMTAARAAEPLRVPSWRAGKDWTYIVDTADGLAALVHAPRPRHAMYHLGAGRMWVVEEVVAAFRELFPSLSTSELSDPAAANPNIAPAGLRAALAISRIKDDVDFSPRYTLSEGLRAYRIWLEAESASASMPQAAGGPGA
jgi:nucleoside-diphosphate-sugar epimerase